MQNGLFQLRVENSTLVSFGYSFKQFKLMGLVKVDTR